MKIWTLVFWTGCTVSVASFGSAEGMVDTLEKPIATWSTHVEVSCNVIQEEPPSLMELHEQAGNAHEWSTVVWPLPQSAEEAQGAERQLVGVASSFKFVAAAPGKTAGFLTKAFSRSCQRVRTGDVMPVQVITKLEIEIDQSEVYPPQHGINESYSLVIQAPTSKLTARSQYGARHGVEMFSQLFDTPGGAVRELSLPLTIEDRPWFQWRGISMDVARHFYPMPTLRKLLDGMAMNKMNVLHLHLSDSQAFPAHLFSHPEIAEVGAFGADQVYSTGDLRELVEYAAGHGIRVMPELDMPGHAFSMGRSHPEILGKCPNLVKRTAKTIAGVRVADFNIVSLNVINNQTVKLITDIVQELASIFSGTI
jgi:N-acetyl-beta-hexosaminidase